MRHPILVYPLIKIDVRKGRSLVNSDNKIKYAANNDHCNPNADKSYSNHQ